MIFVQSEATAARRRFSLYLVDATDGITPEVGEAGGQPQISKNGAAFGNTTATLVAVGNGSYYVELTAVELDTLGDIIVRYKSAATAEFNAVADVLAFNVHSATVSIPETQIDQIVNEVWDEPINEHTGVLNAAGLTLFEIYDDVNINMPNSLAAIQADTNAIEAVLGALSVAASAGNPNTTNTIVAMLKQIVNTLEGTVGIPTYPAAALPGNGVSLAEAIRVLSENLTANYLVTNSVQNDTNDIQTRIPAALVDGRIDANVSGWSGEDVATPTVAGVPEVDLTFWRGSTPVPLQVGQVWAYVGGMDPNVITAAAIDPAAANEIGVAAWEVPSYLHTTEGTTGAALVDAAAGGGATPPTVAEIVEGVWDGPAVLHAIPETTGGVLSTRASPAQVNEEVMDVMYGSFFPEPPQGAPAESASLVSKIGFLYKLARNKITSSETGIQVYSNVGDVVDHKAAHVDAAGVYTRDEFVSGP